MTGLSAQDRRIAAEIDLRLRSRKIFLEYSRIYDLDNPTQPGAYGWQAEVHNASATHPERLLMAANRVGKTQSAAAETAMHLIGEYPAWYQGRRFFEPVRCWTGAERTEDSKEVIQSALLGAEGEHGTGWIPRDRILDVTYRQAGVSNVVDCIYVRHKTGGTSQVTLKTYQMEAKGWRGAMLHFVWLDEECKQDIYTEAQTRVLDKKGLVLMTFTPVSGVTEVVHHFLEAQNNSGIFVKNVTWDDAPHIDPVEKERLWNSYPVHERETRAKGMPMLGEGAVFPIADEDISCEPFTLPDHFYRINGVDFGIDHPASGAFCAWDKDADTFYVYDCYRRSGETPVYHAANLKKHGTWIPNAWPHDGLQKDKGSGIALKNQYRSHGAYMLREHAHYPDERGNSTEPSIIEMYEWMRSGRFKVFSNQAAFFEEKRLYHRKNGLIVRKKDDILSGARYAFMMRRFAKIRPPLMVASRAPRRPIVGGWRAN